MKFLLEKIDFSNRNTRLIVFGGLLAAGVIFILFSNYGLVKRFSLELRKDEIVENIKRQDHIRDSLEKRIKTLETDMLEIERIAREKYGMIKPGEKVFLRKKTSE